MITTSFEYHRAATVDEALQLLAQHGDEAKLLAGGHSLIPVMKLRLASPSALIDISKIDALQGIRDDGDALAIGSGTTHWAIQSSDVVQAQVPLLAQAAGLVGDVQVRNKGTLGGSIAHADPAADYPASLLATGATVNVKGPNGPRAIAAADFFTGLYETNLADDEIITDVRFPKLGAGTGSAYAKFMQPASRFAVVGCAAIVTVAGGVCQDVRVAFSGVAGAAFRDAGVENALNGQPANADSIAAAAAHAAAGADVLSDLHASASYRRHLATVYAKRALTEAVGL